MSEVAYPPRPSVFPLKLQKLWMQPLQKLRLQWMRLQKKLKQQWTRLLKMQKR